MPWPTDDPPLTKRQLGWLITAVGGLAALAVVGVDVLGAGRFAGLGPTQWQALAACALVMGVGLSLVPLGDRLA